LFVVLHKSRRAAQKDAKVTEELDDYYYSNPLRERAESQGRDRDIFPSRGIVLDSVRRALVDVVDRDQVLLELSAHELAIVHRFGHYLESHLSNELAEHGLSVDLDYDRRGYMQKHLPERPDRDGSKRFRPDLIIHRRLDDSQNVLVVEWKKRATVPIIELLEYRLQLLLSSQKDGDYGYRSGVIIDSGDDGVRWRAYDESGPIADWNAIERL
jgi:hypothetical protein